MMYLPSKEQLKLEREIDPWLVPDMDSDTCGLFLSPDAPEDIVEKYELYRRRYVPNGNLEPVTNR